MLASKCNRKRPLTIAALIILSVAILSADVTGAAAFQRPVAGFSNHAVFSHTFVRRGAINSGIVGRGSAHAYRARGRDGSDDGAVAAAVFGGLALGLLGAAAGAY